MESTDLNATKTALLQEKQQREKRCAERLQEVLSSERCQLIGLAGITNDGRIVTGVSLVSMD